MLELDVETVDYERYSNRQLAAVPLVALLLALVVIGGWYATTGSPVNPGIDLTGGTELRIGTDASQATVVEAFDTEVTSIRPVEDPAGYLLTFQSTDDRAIRERAIDSGYDVVYIQTTSATFAAGTQQLAIGGVVAAFVGMSVVVFLLFRSALPSLAVVLSAFGDIVIPVAVMNLLGIQLSLGTVAALLMLIGYSVDSDILLTNHVLRRGGGFYESAYRAMRTGVTMTLTSLSAAIVMAIVASLFGVSLLAAIGTVLAIGLATDLGNTYLLNLSLLRWYRGIDA
jgi:preprotein translocase subunit SecF